MTWILAPILAACASMAYADGMPHKDDPCDKPIPPHLMEPKMPEIDKRKDDEVKNVDEPHSALLMASGLALVAVAVGVIGNRLVKGEVNRGKSNGNDGTTGASVPRKE